MTILQFTNTNLKEVSAEITAALKAIGDKHGIAIETKFTKGTALTLNYTVQASVKDAAGTVISQGKSDFQRHAAAFGLDPALFGRTFTSKGTAYKITGMNPGAWRYPVNCERIKDGHQFRFPAETILRHFPTKTAKAA